MYIDTHCHLDFDEYKQDQEEVIARAKDSGVDCIINVGSSLSGSEKSVELANKYNFIYAAVGVHPHHASDVDDGTIDFLRKLGSGARVVAVGEVGLDYYRNYAPKDAQRESFIKFIHLAAQLNLPLILHDREAHEDILPVLKSEAPEPIKGVIHCFSGDINFAHQCLDTGLFISFTCNITFSNAAGLREVARFVPMDRLLLETDSPFLSPQQFRGKRNEPAYVRYLAEQLAELKGIGIEEIARITTKNSRTLFKI